MQDKTALGISDPFRQFIEALVEEVIINGEPFDAQKKWLRKYSEAEGLNYKIVESNLNSLFEAIKELEEHESKSAERLARNCALSNYFSETEVDKLIDNAAAIRVQKEAERIAQEEAEREAREERRRRAGEEAQRKAKEEAERKAQLQAKLDAERKAREEAERKAREAAKCEDDTESARLKDKKKVWPWIATAVVALLVILIAVFSGGKDDEMLQYPPAFVEQPKADNMAKTQQIAMQPQAQQKSQQALQGGNGSANGHSYVDLGLPSGTLWATCNVGASKHEGYGNYYAWGETSTKNSYNFITYKYANGSYYELTKYCNKSNYGNNGFTDNLTTLEPRDDAATANWGNGWYTPAKNQWDELLKNTSNKWTTQNGVQGRLFTAKNGQTLFLPAAGCCLDDERSRDGYYGYYWSSSLDTDYSHVAWKFCFTSDSYDVRSKGGRDVGISIRPVRSARQN